MGAVDDTHSSRTYLLQHGKEALALSRLNHPNIAMVFDFDTQEEIDFLVTEYIPGTTPDASAGPGFLAEKQVIRLGLQLAEGLRRPTSKESFIGDLKPGNLRVTPDGRLKILDFGIAKLLPTGEGEATETLTQAQGVTGTLRIWHWSSYEASSPMRGRTSTLPARCCRKWPLADGHLSRSCQPRW
jgi:serine/threonine protein kinase